MIRQYELVEKVKSYDPDANEDLLNRAYVFSMKAHGSQKRASGDPYFSHPLEVAGILSDMKLDHATIATALLHDTVEDTTATLDEIRRLFGSEVANLVNGVTKLSQIELQSVESRQAENFRKLVLAMSNDIRVLLIKLADRLHNMRTLSHVKDEEKRRRVARETLEIYAPLAERIGIQHFKEELEDLSFKELNLDARDSILTRLHFLEQEGGKKTIQNIIEELEQVFAEGGIKVRISGRVKSPYSIWRKMHKKNIAFEQLSDIMAFRVVVDTVAECYQVLGLIHSKYMVVPGRFKDYISTPKPNNYQSLHTSVIGPYNQRIEIQIRTQEMHEIAELGVAAHWQYKQGASKDAQGYHWLRSLLEILENASNPEEFLEHTKLEMFQDQVFCFTPAGDLIPLPRGATPIDFAYAIHSEVGNHCVAAKINGRMVPLRTILHNGDQIEILTSKTQIPSPTWERFVVTGKARANIRRFIRSEQRSQFIDLGRSILQKTFQQEGFDFSERNVTPALKKFKVETVDDLYALVGEGLHTAYEVLRLLHPEYQTKPPKAQETPLAKLPQKKAKETAVSIRGLIPGMAVHYAKCCHPLPGDKIAGIVMTGTGVTIHTYDCENLRQYTDEPDRWIDVDWDEKDAGGKLHMGRLIVNVANKPGSLASITTIISKLHANISNLKITQRTEAFFEMMIDLEVKGSDQLENIMASLRAASIVNSVERARN